MRGDKSAARYCKIDLTVSGLVVISRFLSFLFTGRLTPGLIMLDTRLKYVIGRTGDALSYEGV